MGYKVVYSEADKSYTFNSSTKALNSVQVSEDGKVTIPDKSYSACHVANAICRACGQNAKSEMATFDALKPYMDALQASWSK